MSLVKSEFTAHNFFEFILLQKSFFCREVLINYFLSFMIVRNIYILYLPQNFIQYDYYQLSFY